MSHKNNIPKKFKDKKFTFIESIVEPLEEDNSLQFFPKDIKFVRKEKDEEIILVTRRHWIAYVTHIFIAFIVPIIPIVLLFLSSGHPDIYGKGTIYIGLFVASIVISINIFVTALVQWFYNVSVITDKRILSLNVVNIFQHKYTEILWTKIQDVSHDSIGPLNSLFDIGNVYIDTAGEGVDLILKFVPRPRDVQDVIDNLVDLAHKGEL
ncbi:MAG: PH domain-containing protein [Candidatus Dojkabacteria bacterium]|nr:PH domain-containing protein [Candidatus Dojkabacteria bacterium]